MVSGTVVDKAYIERLDLRHREEIVIHLKYKEAAIEYADVCSGVFGGTDGKVLVIYGYGDVVAKIPMEKIDAVRRLS